MITLSSFFKVSIDYILPKDELEPKKEYDDRKAIMNLYKGMDQYNRDTWIIIGKRLLGGQLHINNDNYIFKNED